MSRSPYQLLVGDGDDLPAMGYRYPLDGRGGGRIDPSELRADFLDDAFAELLADLLSVGQTPNRT